ncbi:MAG: 4Fe-4S dicluster domain-containing protein [Chloroflexi bacterium]|nr:4Fe-4S dicluster domain-containing protein [Anaerolineaceae bacterium]NMB86888.1 4Fe-4S dicluster domain-containing protein [Chloroflexota bacterium]
MAEEVQEKKWGMVIDLDICSGCNACVTACSMENNIPWVGEDEVAYGRGMHWIRMERFWHGEYPAVTPEYTPMLCQQCGSAPCEPVCPVYASVHSEDEQINVQVYNRCIGTRYCANNCPYFVRQFNWFDYEWPEPLNYYLNPDVTVRRRGVMEKCTFCIQRIRRGEDQASAEGRELQDGEVVPACAQACPTDAIVFGNLRDPNSRVSQLAHSQRGMRVLEELGTEPSIVYLKGVGNYGS